MTRSSFALKTLGLGIFLLGSLAACGGDKPPPKAPDTTPSAEADGGSSDTSTASTDAKDGGSTSTDTAPPSPPPAPAALALPSGSAKLKVEGKKKLDLELKSDGTVNNAGKMAAKISGMELQGPDGKAQLKVDSDGVITTGDGAAYAKFDGDDLTTQTSAKWSIGDDGAMSATDEKGKKSSLGKADGVGSAKRAALLSIAFVTWGTKAPAPPAAKPAPAGKTAPKKPGAAPAPKK